MQALRHLFDEQPAQVMNRILVLEEGKVAPERANIDFGLALASDEIDYLLDAFKRLAATRAM